MCVECLRTCIHMLLELIDFNRYPDKELRFTPTEQWFSHVWLPQERGIKRVIRNSTANLSKQQQQRRRQHSSTSSSLGKRSDQ